MRLEDMTDDQLGAHVRDRHTRLRAAHKAGLTKHDPDETFNHQSRLLRACRDAMPGNVASSKELELNDHGGAVDDPSPTPGSAGVPDRPGKQLHGAAMDAIIPGYSRMGNRHHQNTLDDDGIVIIPK